MRINPTIEPSAAIDGIDEAIFILEMDALRSEIAEVARAVDSLETKIDQLGDLMDKQTKAILHLDAQMKRRRK